MQDIKDMTMNEILSLPASKKALCLTEQFSGMHYATKIAIISNISSDENLIFGIIHSRCFYSAHIRDKDTEVTSFNRQRDKSPCPYQFNQPVVFLLHLGKFKTLLVMINVFSFGDQNQRHDHNQLQLIDGILYVMLFKRSKTNSENSNNQRSKY